MMTLAGAQNRRPPVKPPLSAQPAYMRETGETFAPIELDKSVTAHLRSIKYDGKSAMEGRVSEVVNWAGMTMPQRLAFLRSFVEDTAKDPAISSKTARILDEAGAAVRDYRAQWAALLHWIQRNVRYVNEADEKFQSPQFTLTHRYGDCLPEDTPILVEGHRVVTIRNVTPGMRIWGKDRWSEVQGIMEKGVLPVTAIRLTNGSTFRATEDHKVYVENCRLHGACCDFKKPTCESTGTVRIRVSELREGAVMLTPERIPYGTETMDPDRAYVEGLFVADGSIHHKHEKADGATSHYDFSIAGRDGQPKERQKAEVAAICDRLGLPYRVDFKEITVKDRTWAERMGRMGAHAQEKHAPSINLDEQAATALLRGLMADSGANTNGPGRTFTTTSRRLAMQVRLLQKMSGRTCGYRYVENHGGLGTHPVHRLNARVTNEERSTGTEKRLRVKSIEREIERVPCYDIQTDDHYVYLPWADVTVSNCDDFAILLAALGHAHRLPWRFVLSGRNKKTGARVRWCEGVGPCPGGVEWGHIYLGVGGPPFHPTWWTFAEPTLQVPLGWDVVGSKGKIAGRADMGGASRVGYMGAEASPPATPVVRDPGGGLSTRAATFTKTLPWSTIVAGILSSVGSLLVTQQLLKSQRTGRR